MKQRAGFTIVELMVAISVLIILVGITGFSLSTWRSRTAATEVKNDLQAAVGKLRDNRTWNNAYPSSLSSVFQPSGQVTMTYVLRGGGQSYCLQAASTAVSTVKYYYDSANDQGIVTAACS